MRAARFLLSLLLAAGIVSLCFSSTAAAAPVRSAAPPASANGLPDPLPVDNTPSNNRTAVVDALKSGNIGNSQMIEEYFNKYELPRMTSHTLRQESDTFSSREGDLPTYRRKFKSSYLNQVKAGPARAKLNEIVFEFLTKKIVLGKFDPVLKYNAVLMIGDLTDDEASTQKTALLYARAYTALMTLAKNPKPQMDYLKVAALVGLQRSAEALATAPAGPAHEELMMTMLTLIGQQQPPEGRTAGGHAWIRASAARVLGSLGYVGKDYAVPKALVKVVMDETALPSLRFAAVESLGQLNYPADAKVDIKPYVREIGKLAVESIKKQLADRESRAENRTAVADDLTTRRKLKSIVHSVNIALVGEGGRSGLLKLAGSQDKSGKPLTDALRSIDTSLDKDAVDEIPDQVTKLEEVLQTAYGLPRSTTDKAVVAQ
jgi:hypothetical protein